MSTIRDTMSALVAIQSGLEVTQPKYSKVARAYPYSPPQSATITPPAFTNSWDLQPVERSPGAGRHRRYTIHMQLYVGQATNGDDSLTADIATAYEDAIQLALGKRNAAGLGGVFLYGLIGETLMPTVESHVLRGGQPTLAILERGNLAYIGLDLFLDVSLHDVMMHS